ncbi:MAG: alpha-L-fucosidase, partial [Candidatus Acidiferrales bacterium]
MSISRRPLSRRTMMKVLAGAVPAWVTARSAGQSAPPAPSITAGPFAGTRESLGAYRVPQWLNDAKFGIWAHWGPQSAAEQGDWYARNIYIQGSRQNLYHVQHYGHPSKFGYKDIVSTWTGDKFDPNYLMQLYKKAGAKYFVSMGVHHDNFDMWDSKYQRWNAAKMGIKRDVVGLWRQAAQENGLRFGVSDHLWISYKWFAVSHMADKTGALAGVPYDGANPQWADLYHDYTATGVVPPEQVAWNDDGIPDVWRREWFRRIQDLYSHYQPDMLYIDGPIPFEETGLSLVADFYNRDAARRGGVVDAVYTSKRREDCATGTCALDVERGVVETIWPRPWQTDTCIGNWHYYRDFPYKTPKRVVDMLVDIVSRNGNLLLNFPLPNSGMLDDRELAVLDGITKWMAVNNDAIYSSRPWKIFGAGPSTVSAAAPAGETKPPSAAAPASAFNEKDRQDLTEADVRFTTKDGALYAFVMGVPGETAVIAPLGAASAVAMGKIANVELLGAPGKLEWSQDSDALRVKLPAQKPCDYAIVFR